MKHSVTINLTIEGDVNSVLTKIQYLFGDYSRIHDDPKVKITGINLYQEHDFTTEPPQVATEEVKPPQSLDEE